MGGHSKRGMEKIPTSQALGIYSGFLTPIKTIGHRNRASFGMTSECIFPQSVQPRPLFAAALQFLQPLYSNHDFCSMTREEDSTMGEVTNEQVKLMLQLYELRREEKLRKARAWFFSNFFATSLEDMMKNFPMDSEMNANIRMVTSYWEMVASIVNRGLIDEELFFENSGEQWVVWERVQPVAQEWRKVMKNPHIFKNLEEHCKRLDAWREKKAPGSTETMRERMRQMMPKQAQAKSGG